MAETTEKSPLSPASLRLETAAKLFSAQGQKPITIKMLQADIDAGAPTNADGTLNLVHYTAWLARGEAINAD